MKEKLVVYIPMDRRHAIAAAKPLPDHTTGAALFADISGFTTLAEALVRELGPHRGAEELTRYLNLVYDVVIEDLHRYGGSVISFAGDAITCWLDVDDGRRAVGCALAMQQAMQQFAQVKTPGGSAITISITVAVATGPARRFCVGNPDIRLIDALAGETLVRLAAAEHHAKHGEVILDALTLQSLGDVLEVGEIRTDPESGLGFGVVSGLTQTASVSPWPPLDVEAMALDEIRRWILPSVYQKIARGLEEFLAELRPTVALFLRFGGIDYDNDEDAGGKLDTYIRWVQSIVERYRGTLIDLNIGDKGSYIYINFGAPIAHENNAEHAALAALALRRPPELLAYIDLDQIGISQGRMRAGVYGGAGHRTYGVLGDEVNLAARLMMRAEPGQILVSQAAHLSIADVFLFEPLPAIHVKGKSAPVNIFSLNTVRRQQSGQSTGYAQPMIGREVELIRVEQVLAEAAQGQGRVVLLTGEAGVGKSRLVAEIVQRAEISGWKIAGGASESYGLNSSYLVWHSIWRNLFDLDSLSSPEEQLADLTEQVGAFDEQWIHRLPLLDTVLQLAIPDNDLTRSLDAKRRKTSLHSLLVDLLRAKTASVPTLIVLEDCHWLDPQSSELLLEIGSAISDRPVCLLLVSRDSASDGLAVIESLPDLIQLELDLFGTDESAQLIKAKLAQLSGSDVPISETLVDRLVAQSQGNPFYLEELIAYLYFQGLLEANGGSSLQPDLPESLHRLVLSRLDQLSDSQRITARVASVIGRIFRAAWLWGAYPSLGDPTQVLADLEVLQRQDLTANEPVEAEQTYFFKQVLTQSVTYESLPYAMRSAIHGHIARFIERAYPDQLDQYLDLLAFHYDHSENREKRIEYLLRAGAAAQAQYANRSAIDYYRRVLPLLQADKRNDIVLKLGQVLELTGQWDEAKSLYEQGLVEVQRLGDRRGQAWCETALGELLRKQGQFDEARDWFERARAAFQALDDQSGVGQVLHYMGTMADQQGDYERAHDLYQESLTIRRRLDDKRSIASLLSNLGIVARRQGDLTLAEALYTESLEIRRQIGDRWAVAVSNNNLGNVLLDLGQHDAARACLEEALALQREIGDRWMIGNSLNNLGNVVRSQNDYATACTLYGESLAIYRALGDKWALAYLLEDVAWLAALQSKGTPALQLVGAASVLRKEIGAPLTASEAEKLNAALAPALRTIDWQSQAALTAAGRAMSLSDAIDLALQSTDSPSA